MSYPRPESRGGPGARGSGNLQQMGLSPLMSVGAGGGLMRPPTGSTRAGGIVMAAPVAAPSRVEARPVTQQGIAGMRTKMGPGRQVADKSYYLQELRAKVAEISAEIQSMRGELEAYTEGTARYGRLERKYEDVVKEVRALEGQLADYNLALDKLRTNTDVMDIQDAHMRLKDRNDEQRRRVDEVFVQRTSGEKYTQQLEEELRGLHDRAIDLLGQSAGGQQAQGEYHDLRQQNEELEAHIRERENELAEMDMRIRAARQELNSDALAVHARGTELLRRKEDLLRKREELLEETSQVLSPEDMRERLLQKVKEHNAEIKEAEERVRQMEDELEDRQEEARRRESEIGQAKKHAAKAKKYEALYERDRKMKSFISSYKGAREAELESKRNLQQNIVALLEHISKNAMRQRNMPDVHHFSEMRKELSFKHQTMAHSKDTLEHVKKELEKRKEELAKINKLDQKIPKELQSLRTRMDDMRRELDSFSDPESMRREAENIKQRLVHERERTRDVKEALKLQVQQLGQDLEAANSHLKQNSVSQKIESMEQELRLRAQSTFTLSDYIRSRKLESDYEGLRRDIFEVVATLNEQARSDL